jgi:hypothetical protein
MTPTPEEKKWLRNYLYQVMDYRETFEEVYDHMLLALEDLPRPQFFETAVMNVIDSNFGGNEGLSTLEASYRQSVDEMASTQFKNNFRRWFDYPLVIITASVFTGLVYLELSPVKTALALVLFFAVLLILPVIICAVRATRLGYQYAEAKASIKDDIFRRLAYKSNRILFNVLWMSAGINQLAVYLFKLNNYLAAVVGLFAIFLLTWPHVRHYRLRRQNPDHEALGGRKKLPLVPLKENLFYGWLVFVLFSIDTLSLFVSNPNHPAPHGQMPMGVAAIFYSMVTAILVLMMINVLATIRLYRSEYKAKMMTN